MAKKSRSRGKALSSSVATAEKKSKKHNPFEMFNNRKPKQNVLNRRQKGSKRNLSESRSNAMKSRYSRLTEDIKQYTKSNTFQDNRFGEKSALSEDDKLLMRLRKARSKKSRYNLDEVDEDEVKHQLTHMGQALGTSTSKPTKMDLNNDDIYDDENFDPAAFVEALSGAKKNGSTDAVLESLIEQAKGLSNTSGTTMPQKRTREEVMKEVMMKSKLYKAERQREKEQIEEAREKNDEMFNSLFGLDSGLQFRPSKGAKLDDMTEAQKSFLEREEEDRKKENQDDYNQLVKQLQTERKAEATEKTYTPEEIAWRERKKLEKLQLELEEKRRQEYEDDDFDPKNAEKELSGHTVDKFGNRVINTLFSSKENEVSDQEGSESDEDVADESESASVVESKSSTELKIALPTRNIPFLIELEDSFSHIDFVRLLDRYNEVPNHLDIIIDRIAKSNSVHLKVENRKKMITLYNALLEHMFYISGLEEKIQLRKRRSGDGWVSVLFRHLERMSKELVKNVQEIFSPKIQRMKRNFTSELSKALCLADFGGDYGEDHVEEGMPHKFLSKRKRGGHKGKKGVEKMLEEEANITEDMEFLYEEQVSTSNCKCWPSPSELSFFKLVLFLFPLTDFRHSVTGPLLLLISEIFNVAPIRGPKDVLSALSLATIVAEAIKNGRKEALTSKLPLYISEIVLIMEALFGQISCALSSKNIEAHSSGLPVTWSKVANSSKYGVLLKEFRFLSKLSKKSVRTSSLEKLPNSTTILKNYQETPKAGEFASLTVCLATQLVNLFTEIDYPQQDLAFESTLSYISKATRHIKEKNSDLKNLQKNLQDSFRKSQEKRESMLLIPETVKAIKELEPLFSVEFFGKDKPTEKVMMKQLQKQVKKEKRNVMKEIRRDTALLASEKRKAQFQKEQEQRKKRQNNLRFIEEMNRNINNAVKEGGRISGGGTSNIDMKGRRKR